ncbi:T9SS type A sorting domain-containing protein [Mariniflexile gromovii]|uniref:T9SS type A sorting domain-containing protein n=1 Tax=Mariniflexile gromovii TaxID=362523 RepID=A0ABS4BQ57_9FLAO|nr:T9SS type A sorting domain-containing protein [Mariniflexile gromovii]MBP0902548.1 T9SS type A sorting domain-containing protein [Mariniflexile gromovii]
MRKTTFLALFIFTIVMQGQDKLFSTVDQFFDGSTWVNSRGTNYEYDSNNNLTLETELVWDLIESKWKNDYYTEYTYNANNKVTLELYKEWNDATSQFDDSERVVYSYNGNGDITEYLLQSWENGAWVNIYKNVFEYANNKINVAYDYDWEGGIWVLKERSTLTYNLNNRPDTILLEKWDGVQYNVSDRDLFTYNGNNKITVKTYETWNGVSWEEEDRIEYDLDSNSNRITETYFYDGGTYVESYTYDLTKLMSNYAHPYKDKTGLDFITEDNPFYNKVESYSSGSNNRTVANYDSALVLSVEDSKIVENKIKVFPNPTSNYVNIESFAKTLNNVEIYNTIGAKVFSTQESRFNIEFLRTGVYFINITDNTGFVFTQKIVKN